MVKTVIKNKRNARLLKARESMYLAKCGTH